MLLISSLLLQASLGAPPADRDLGTARDPDGTTRSYTVSSARVDRSPSWNPESGPPPLPMEKAVTLARQWLQKQNPKFQGFRPSSLQLMRISEGGGQQKWIWMIHFDPKLGDRWLDGIGYEAYLLMDGTVVVPRVTKGSPFGPP